MSVKAKCASRLGSRCPLWRRGTPRASCHDRARRPQPLWGASGRESGGRPRPTVLAMRFLLVSLSSGLITPMASRVHAAPARDRDGQHPVVVTLEAESRSIRPLAEPVCQFALPQSPAGAQFDTSKHMNSRDWSGVRRTRYTSSGATAHGWPHMEIKMTEARADLECRLRMQLDGSSVGQNTVGLRETRSRCYRRIDCRDVVVGRAPGIRAARRGMRAD
jgi:hypothetical protein